MLYQMPDAVAKIKAARPILKVGSWGDGNDSVCMMSALISGAQSVGDCMTAGFPQWLAALNVSLFDANVGADDEHTARYQFAHDVAEALQTPRDMDKARDLFLIAVLERVRPHDKAGVVGPVVNLLRRRISGEEVAGEMLAARAAARADARADLITALLAA